MSGHRRIPGARAILPVILPTLVVVLAVGLKTGLIPDGQAPSSPALVGFMGGPRVGEPADSLAFAPNRLLVQFRDTATKSSLLDVPRDKGARVPFARTGLGDVDALAQQAGIINITRPYEVAANPGKAAGTGADRWFMLDFGNVEDLQGLADEFGALPDVQAVSLDWVAYPTDAPTDPNYAAHWGHNNTGQLPAFDWGGTYTHSGAGVGTPGMDANAPEAWAGAQGYGSAGVVIAIIDSGVDVDHTDLRLVTGYDFGDNDTNPDDNATGAGHGTCCAGVAAAMNNGIGAVGAAPGCSIMPLKVANSAGTMYFSAIQGALYYAADHGAKVISMSLGAAILSDAATETALQYAYNAGAVLLAATGNENKSSISYPACSTYVIGVGAAAPSGDRKRSSSAAGELNAGVVADPRGFTCDGERWWGSSYGSVTKDAAGAVDILGPTILPTCDVMGSGGYRPGDVEPYFNGTSCATPYVAGVAALVLSANPSYTPAQVRAALTTTARDVVNAESVAGWDRYAGYGFVNAQAAVQGATPVAPTAAFTGAPVSGYAPLTVSFTDASTGSPTSWSWDFGDGGSSTAQNPSHVYGSAGTYNVALTATNATGSNTVTRTSYITVGVLTAPVADFSATPLSGSAPLAVTFTDLSQNAPSSWAWTFGDGGTATTRNPSHTYAAEGTYDVTLTATNAAGTNTVTRSGYITVTASVGTWVTITSDNFELGMGNYTDGGIDMMRYTGTTLARQGKCAADIQDNSGNASSFFHKAGINVTRYADMKVEFYFRGVGMEKGEDFFVEYYNGTAWVRAATFVAGTNFTNGAYAQAVVNLPRSSFAYPATARLRFRCDASDDSDDIYIDQITWSGLLMAGTDAGLDNGPGAPPGDSLVPAAAVLEQNRPNPFNPVTQIAFTLPQDCRARLTIYNLRGQQVAELANGQLAAGEHVVTWDATGLPSGVYFSRLEGPGISESRKMTLLK